jgi:hypothetical protein
VCRRRNSSAHPIFHARRIRGRPDSESADGHDGLWREFVVEEVDPPPVTSCHERCSDLGRATVAC